MSEFTTPRRDPPMDAKNQRYRLPHPDTGRETLWTRSTTWAKTIADIQAIHKWEKRMVVKGVASRADLYALAAATPLDDKDKLNRIADDAKEAAKASSGSNLGTALHAFTEQADRGEEMTAPVPWVTDIAAYNAALAAEGIAIIRDYIERVVVVPTYQVAGKFDRIVKMPDGRRLIADVKTTQKIDYSWGEIAIQLALYANAQHMMTEDYTRHLPMPEVDQDEALVMHVPAGQGRCDLYTVDIKSGWEAAYICKIVRQWRSRKDLARTYTPNLLHLIATAPTRTALEALWGEYRGDWNDTHTTAAQARIAELTATERATA